MSIFSKNKTHILNDFSTVLKAKFFVYKKRAVKVVDNEKKLLDAEITAGKATGATESWAIGKINSLVGGSVIGGKCPYEFNNEILYAQINPNSLNVRSGQRRQRGTPPPVKLESYTFTKDKGYSDDEDSYSFSLVYDIFDEYQAASMNGTNPKVADLTDEGATSLPRLIELSKKDDYAVYFKWGPNQFFGVVSKAEAEYKSFSRYGNPLKAELSVTLLATGWTITPTGRQPFFEMWQPAKNFVQGFDTAEAAATAASMAGQTAFRETQSLIKYNF